MFHRCCGNKGQPYSNRYLYGNNYASRIRQQLSISTCREQTEQLITALNQEVETTLQDAQATGTSLLKCILHSSHSFDIVYNRAN